MDNPSGPYPGRQLFLGLTADQRPCFAYLVTGRSPESRQRKATIIENTVRMGPLGDIAYDALKHYTALKYDQVKGLIAVTNGIQTEAIFETYKLLFNVSTPATKDYLEKLMEGANFEPDSLHTPRIGGVITSQSNLIFIIGIKTHLGPAVAHKLEPTAGRITGISTYKGNLDNPEPTSPTAQLSELEFKGNNPQELAKYLYDISAVTYKGEDIRVCALGGIYSGSSWDIAIVNKY